MLAPGDVRLTDGGGGTDRCPAFRPFVSPPFARCEFAGLTGIVPDLLVCAETSGGLTGLFRFDITASDGMFNPDGRFRYRQFNAVRSTSGPGGLGVSCSRKAYNTTPVVFRVTQSPTPGAELTGVREAGVLTILAFDLAARTADVSLSGGPGQFGAVFFQNRPAL